MKNKQLYTILLVLLILMPANLVVIAQDDDYPLKLCEKGAFSTEEGFKASVSTYDNNRQISDGDILSVDGQLCARNVDLMQVFGTGEVDLGLDAVDIIDFESRLIAFSTELDDPRHNFTDGDILTTSGSVIPNHALLASFETNYGYQVNSNLGLDALQFVGDPDAIQELFEIAHGFAPGDWQGTTLQATLDELHVDIWFSIESSWIPTSEVSTPLLNGDILSARDGTVVMSQHDLLNILEIPAGVQEGGVNLGLDALAAGRGGDVSLLIFSTKILYNGEPSFTDGDLLWHGGNILNNNRELVSLFRPSVDFLGLDALWMPLYTPSNEPNIQSMCGRNYPVTDFDGGIVAPGDSGSGLYRENDSLRHPCGGYVPIDGFLPSDGGISRFRVAFRPVDIPVQPAGTAPGIQTNWIIEEWGPRSCDYYGGELSTDSNGWMDAGEYLAAMDEPCAQNNLYLAVWDTRDLVDPNGHYVLWLEWEDANGVLHKESYEHHLQLDNIAPVVDGVQIKLPGDNTDETPAVSMGGEVPAGAVLEIWGQFSDDHFQEFRLVLRGGDPPIEFYYPRISYYVSLTDNIDNTGTTPDDMNVYLVDLDMVGDSPSFTAPCCYVLDLDVSDAAIRHNFDGKRVREISSITSASTTFSVAPGIEVTPTP